MNRHFHRLINTVRFRQRIQRTLDYAAWGLFAAALAVLISPLLAGLIVLVSIIFGFVRFHTSSSAARLIDRHYHLKDRILTAITLLRHTNRTPMQQLQIDDATEHLISVQPQAVHPIRLPKIFWAALAVLLIDFIGVAVVHSHFYQSSDKTELIYKTLPIENRELREEIIAKTEELAQKHTGEQSLSKLSEQLEILMDKFDLGNIDTKESFMTLSEMKEAFQSALDSLQLETMDMAIQELAKTLELAERTFPISKALEKGDYNQAASELKKLDAETLDSLSKPERKAMAEQMKSIAENAEKRNQKPLQEAAQKMSEALEKGDSESGKSAADSLADEVEKHRIRKSIAKDLANKQMILGIMKTESGEDGNMSGGKGTNKSNTASQTWGSGSAGNPNAGQETNLQGQRQQQILTGTLGEQGDSVTETLDSQEITAAQNLRQYREQYQHYQKISEAVLESEPIPLGQRQMIRRYFESIRPNLKTEE